MATMDMKEAGDIVVGKVREMERALAAGPQAAFAASAPAALAMDTNDFCSIWDKAKPILEFLVGIIRFIPGVPAIGGSVLAGLIEIGDKIHAAQCRS